MLERCAVLLAEPPCLLPIGEPGRWAGTPLANESCAMEHDSHLRYLDAKSVDTPAGRLGHAPLFSPTNETIGRLDGILFDPLARQVRYYVVASTSWLSPRHYLLPLTTARLDRDRHGVEVDVDADDLSRLQQVEPRALPRYSDDDLVAALFDSPRSREHQ